MTFEQVRPYGSKIVHLLQDNEIKESSSKHSKMLKSQLTGALPPPPPGALPLDPTRGCRTRRSVGATLTSCSRGHIHALATAATPLLCATNASHWHHLLMYLYDRECNLEQKAYWIARTSISVVIRCQVRLRNLNHINSTEFHSVTNRHKHKISKGQVESLQKTIDIGLCYTFWE